jgi:hypothetical protein
LASAGPKPVTVTVVSGARDVFYLLCITPAASVASFHAVQDSASVLLRQWEPLVLQWPLLPAAARQDLISKLASTELIFFLAVKDRTTYEEVKLPCRQTVQDGLLFWQFLHKGRLVPCSDTPCQ